MATKRIVCKAGLVLAVLMILCQKGAEAQSTVNTTETTIAATTSTTAATTSTTVHILSTPVLRNIVFHSSFSIFKRQ